MTPDEIVDVLSGNEHERYVDEDCARRLAEVIDDNDVCDQAVLERFTEECEKFESEFRDRTPLDEIRRIALHQVQNDL